MKKPPDNAEETLVNKKLGRPELHEARKPLRMITFRVDGCKNKL